MSKRIALQLYSLREYVREDPIGMLKKVKASGFNAVEFAGYYGFEAAELKAIVDEIGLEPLSSHVGFDLLENHLDEVVAYSRDLGLKFVICPAAKLETVEDAAKVAAVLNRAHEALIQHGIQVGYHNHNFEFVEVDGAYLMDHLIKGYAHDDMIVEIDTCWARFAEVDPVAYIDGLGAQAGPTHIKELGANYKSGDKSELDVQIGLGIVDFKGVLAVLEKNGALEKGIVVEQEGFTGDPYEDLKKGVDYLLSVWPK